jgi:hypothetical protein
MDKLKGRYRYTVTMAMVSSQPSTAGIYVEAAEYLDLSADEYGQGERHHDLQHVQEQQVKEHELAFGIFCQQSEEAVGDLRIERYSYQQDPAEGFFDRDQGAFVLYLLKVARLGIGFGLDGVLEELGMCFARQVVMRARQPRLPQKSGHAKDCDKQHQQRNVHQQS